MQRWVVMQLNWLVTPPNRTVLAIKDTEKKALDFLNIPDARRDPYSGYVITISGSLTPIQPIIEIQPFDEVDL